MAITIEAPGAGTAVKARRTTSPLFTPAKPLIEYVGTFRRQVFANADGFKIIKLEDGTTVKLTDLHNLLTAGITYRFSGYWKDNPNPQYGGRDFHAQHFVVDKPTNEKGVVGFLSKMCTNIGPFVARQIYAKFGAESVEVVRNSPDKIAAANILEYQKALQASECLKNKDGMEQTKIALNEVLNGFGLGSSAAIDACIKHWGVTAPEIIRRDPFKLMVARIRGAGFTRCDKLYLSLGLLPTRLKRQMLAAWYKLKTNRDGHTWVSETHLGVINESAMKLGLRTGWIAEHTDELGRRWYADGQKARDEAAIAKHIKRLKSWKMVAGDLSTALWPKIEDIEGLSDHQRTTLAPLLQSPISILGGKPGTGKTYTIAKLIKAAVAYHGSDSVGACAPTGKAARRLQENISANGVYIQARTIHSLFKLSVQAEEDDGNDEVDSIAEPDTPKGENELDDGSIPIPRILFIDEVSMLDASVAARLLSKLPTGTHVIFIGDVNQLAPVGHGSPLRDLLKSKAIPTGELTEIRRNSGAIVTACHQIAGAQDFDIPAKYNPETGDNLRAIYSTDSNDTLAGLVKIHSLLPGYGFDPVNDAQVIAALNTKGTCSKLKINEVLQDVLNPASKKVDGKRFRVRDKVIYTKNMELAEVEVASGIDRKSPEHYFNSGAKSRVANGDIGRVIAIDEKATIVRFEAPQRVVRLSRDTECFLDLAYAVSCHKYQGSESPVVIVVLDPAASTVCCREWVYTAISRAKKLCVIVGQAGLAERFCQRVSIDRRKTFLVSLLKETNGN